MSLTANITEEFKPEAELAQWKNSVAQSKVNQLLPGGKNAVSSCSPQSLDLEHPAGLLDFLQNILTSKHAQDFRSGLHFHPGTLP